MVGNNLQPDGGSSDRAPGARCVLCDSPGGRVVWANSRWRVVAVDDPQFPGCYRVIAQDHVAEFSALTAQERHLLMDVVATVEQVLVDLLNPTKMNLAALGNIVPHLHWHVIPRYLSDTHFPESIWGPQQRDVPTGSCAKFDTSIEHLESTMAEVLSRSDTVK